MTPVVKVNNTPRVPAVRAAATRKRRTAPSFGVVRATFLCVLLSAQLVSVQMYEYYECTSNDHCAYCNDGNAFCVSTTDPLVHMAPRAQHCHVSFAAACLFWRAALCVDVLSCLVLKCSYVVDISTESLVCWSRGIWSGRCLSMLRLLV